MPNHRVPVGCVEYGSTARFQNAKRFGNRPVHLWYVLSDLSACHDIEACIRLIDSRCLADAVSKPPAVIAAFSKAQHIGRDVNADNAARCSDDLGHAFTEKTRTTADIDDGIALGQ